MFRKYYLIYLVLFVSIFISIYSIKTKKVTVKNPDVSEVIVDEKINNNSSIHSPINQLSFGENYEETEPFTYNKKTDYKIETRTIKEVNNHIIDEEIDGSYFIITGFKDKESEIYLNKCIKELVDSVFIPFKNLVEYFTDRFPTEYGRYELYFTCQKMYLDSKYCSIYLDYYQFMNGVHGVSLAKPLTVDIEKKKILKPSDWFLPGTNYKKILTDYCKYDLKKQWVEAKHVLMDACSESSLNQTIEPTRNYDEEITLIPDGFYLVLAYPFCHAEGNWTVKVPSYIFGESCLIKFNKDAYCNFDFCIDHSN
ncbi:MAG: DUF4163 domain-containing protein [Caldisericia bacterium]|jgi:hypothetical protein|nr:DUF4163 domain-containing protein [Caldisericia bacterium]HPO29044.1 DUF4163 domain-containing protein [Caldisericia bacterium]